MVLEEKTMYDWLKNIIEVGMRAREFKRRFDYGEEAKCEECNSGYYVFREGCVTCRHCGYNGIFPENQRNNKRKVKI